jgi:carboxyl-terminal processing protease
MSFQEHSTDRLKENLAKMKAQGMKALVLDLRNNPGGLLSAAIEVASLFVPQGAVVVRTQGRVKSQTTQYKATKGGEYQDIPIAVLLNRGSASASEIVAGALHDNGRAVLVGETTFGKGSVQSVIPFEDYKAALKLTTARYYTPKGTDSIEGKGITPDLEEKVPIDVQIALAKRRRQEHIVENGKPGAGAAPKTEKKPEGAEAAIRGIVDEVRGNQLTADEAVRRLRTLMQNGRAAKEPLDEEDVVDRQLQRAVDAMKVRLLLASGGKGK